jgi:hypothetical protein
VDVLMKLWSVVGFVVVFAYLPIRQYRRGEDMVTLGYLSVCVGCVGAVALIVGLIAPELTLIGIGVGMIALAALGWVLFRKLPRKQHRPVGALKD